MKKHLSIVLINFNSSKYTINCVHSIYNHITFDSYEIIIVENDSNGNDKKELFDNLENSKNLKIIESKFNLGFSGANHFGYQFCNGEYVAFLNNDTVLLEDSFKIMIDYLKANDNVGLVGPKQLNEHNEFIEYCYNKLHSPLDVLMFGKGEKPEAYFRKRIKDFNPEEPFIVGEVSGAFMLFRSKAYEAINGFDTNIFLYYEETDVCFRLKQKGYDTAYMPKTSFIHFCGKSSKSVSPRKEMLISDLYVIQKNYGFFSVNLVRFVNLIRYTVKGILGQRSYFKLIPILFKGGNTLAYSMRHNLK